MIVQNISSFEGDTGRPLTLSSFVDYYQVPLDDIYRRASWSRLCAEANVTESFIDPDEALLTKGLRRIAHANDPVFIKKVIDWLATAGSFDNSHSDEDGKRKLMLHFSLWNSKFLPSDISESFKRLQENITLYDELKELLILRRESIDSVPPPHKLPFSCPLRVHSQYTRDEILAGLGRWTLENQPAFREGTLHLDAIETDAFFVTLNKSEKHYSPTTMYEDYAISDTLFHWQSQSTTSVASPTGQRYIHHKERGYTVMLFVREDPKNKNGYAEPYYFLGAADYVKHEGSRPISFTWRLHIPMPSFLMKQTARLMVN